MVDVNAPKIDDARDDNLAEQLSLGPDRPEIINEAQKEHGQGANHDEPTFPDPGLGNWISQKCHGCHDDEGNGNRQPAQSANGNVMSVMELPSLGRPEVALDQGNRG